MMKRLTSYLLAIAILLCVAGCADKTKSADEADNDVASKNEENVNDSNTTVDSGNKLKGELEFGTNYTNGFAFVKVKGSDKNYCIDKEGSIVFETDNVIFATETKSAVTTGFYNDIVLISDLYRMNYNTICDITGKITTAEELGSTYFLDDAFKDGYIIAVVEGQKSKDDKIGVLNSDLEWVVEPSADIVESLGMEYGVRSSTKFYNDYILYGVDGSIDIRTGEFFQDSYRTKGKYVQASLTDYWSAKYDGYYSSDGQLALDVSNDQELLFYGNATVDVDGAEFINGRSPIVFSNNAEWQHFSVIDQNGELQFQPVDFGENIDYIKIDGDYIFVVGDQNNRNTTARIYDINGKLFGELDPTVILINSQFNMQDGVVRVAFQLYKMDNDGNIAEDSIKWVKYFDANAKPLF